MNGDFDFQSYMKKGIEKTVADVLRSTFRYPRESAFLMRFTAANVAASKRRDEAQKAGDRVPLFLVAGITGDMPGAGTAGQDLPAAAWAKIFGEAEALGISFIFLAGEDPLDRRDVIEAAAGRQNILFPVFTNGLRMDDQYIRLFDSNRNLVPVLRIGPGMGSYERQMQTMLLLQRRGILFGVCVTVTPENLEQVISDAYLQGISPKGCRLLFYVENGSAGVQQEASFLSGAQKERLASAVQDLRGRYPGIIFVSFPGDELRSSGCFAANRLFFYIDARGDAQACPFAPCSDVNVCSASLRQALRSPSFAAMRKGDLIRDGRMSGCILHDQKKERSAN